MSEVRDRPHRDVSRPRLAEALGGLGLLHDDSTAAVRALIERVTGELAPGFGVDLSEAQLTGARWPRDEPVPAGWERDAGSGPLKRAGTDSGSPEAN
jgi:hypothetical protein